jgi:hypothetical protein
MINIQEEVYLIVVKRIKADLAEGKYFSFHHYAIKFKLNADKLQKKWSEKNEANL